MYGLHFREEYDEPVARELESLISCLKALILAEHNENGTHKFDTTLSDATITDIISRAQNSGQLWLRGPWRLDDPDAPNPHQVALRPPVTASGTHHNFAPIGIDTAVVAEIEPSGGNVTLTGLKAIDGSRHKRILLFRNVSDTYSVILKHQNSGSLSAYRFDMPGGADVTLLPDQNVWLYYDPHRGSWSAAITDNSYLGGQTWTIVSKDTDTSRNNDAGSGAAVVVADPHLTFSMSASTTYRIRGTINFQLDNVNTGNTLRHRFTGPSSPTVVTGNVWYISTSGAQVNRTLDAFDASNQGLGAYINGGTDCNGIAYLDLIVQNGSNAGSFTFAWVSGSSSTDSATVFKGSYLEYSTV